MLFIKILELFNNLVDLKQNINFLTRKNTYKTKNTNYKQRLGFRHKFLRESILNMKLLDLSDFYSFSTVTEVENIEIGLIELSKDKRKEIEVFFHLNEDFFDTNTSYIFKTFHLNREHIRNYLADGYTPTFMCSPTNRRDQQAFLYLYKIEKNIIRLIRSDLACYFNYKISGICSNVQEFIEAIIINNVDYNTINFRQVDEVTWSNIRNNYFYTNNIEQIFSFYFECKKNFNELYHKTIKSIQRFNMSKYAEILYK